MTSNDENDVLVPQASYDSVVEDIIQYVYHGSVRGAQAYSRARLALLDALGCAVETAALSEECQLLLGPVVPGTQVPVGCRVPGTSQIVDPVKGAFDIGALVRYLDHNDAYPGAEWGHPSDNLGAIIATADWRSQIQSIPLRTVLTAQIKAYEVQGVLQQRNAFNAYGLDHTILVKIASTAAAAWLLDLPEAAALAALSHAWVDGHPLRTFRQSLNTVPRKGWAGGDACMRAVHLVLLAHTSHSTAISRSATHLAKNTGIPRIMTEAGTATHASKKVDRVVTDKSPLRVGALTGMPSALTTPQWGFNDALLGGKRIVRAQDYGSWVIENVFFKMTTAEGHGISAVEAAADVSRNLVARGLRAEKDIRAIRVRTQQPAMTIINKTGPLRNAADRDHCLQYMVAVTLLKGSPIHALDYMDDSPWTTDNRVDLLRERMIVVEDAGFTRDYYNPEKRSGANGITVELFDGEELDEVVVEFPVGHPRIDDTAEQVLNKFRNNMRLLFQNEEIESIIRAVENDSLPVHEFVDLFTR